MPAGLRPLGNHSIHARTYKTTCESDRCHHGDDLRADLLEGRYILAGVSRSRRDDRNTLLKDNLHDFLDKRAHEHHINTKWLIRPALRLMDLIAQCIGRHMSGTNESETSRIGNRRRKLCCADPCHATLEDGVLDTKHLTNRIMFKH